MRQWLYCTSLIVKYISIHRKIYLYQKTCFHKMATSEAIRKKILEKVFYLKDISEALESHKKKLKSKSWTFVSAIYTQENELVETHVCCRLCKNVFKYNLTDGRGSTSNLSKHINKCSVKPQKKHSNEGNSKHSRDYSIMSAIFLNIEQCLTGSGKIGSGYKSVLSPEHKKLMLSACSDFIIDDLRPFNALEGRGLRSLLSASATIQMLYPRDDLDEVSYYLPHRNTVRNNISCIANEIRTEIKEELSSVFGRGAAGGAIALDLWTDPHRHLSYMCVIAHYINEKFEMCQRTLANEHLASNRAKDGDYVFSVLKKILSNYDVNLEDAKQRIVFMSDRASNLLNALLAYNHITCSLHFLSNSVKKIFVGGRPLVILNVCKSIVLEEKNKMQLLVDVKKEEIGSLIEFLEIFYLATKSMESTSKPTIFCTLAWFDKIERWIKKSPTDSEMTAKQIIIRSLDVMMQWPVSQKMTMMLNLKM